MGVRWKRFLAGMLTMVMAVTAMPAIPATAEESYLETEAYDLEQTKEQILNSEEAAGYENGAVTFPGTGVAVPVGYELTYHLFRQGNTEKEQTVTLMTQDITAAYGDDYELVVGGEVVEGKANVLLDGDGTTYDVYLDQDSSSEEGEESDDSVNPEDQLESLKENASCTFDLTFAPGEQMKEILIRAKMPKEAVGDKEFQIAIYQCSGDLERGTNTNVAVTLDETRETPKAKISIVDDSAEVVDGYLTVLVERSENTNGYTSYSLSAEDGTAVNGEDYQLNSSKLVFSPGVSRQRIHIPLMSADKEEEKTFTLKAAESESKITYTTTEEEITPTTFASARNLLDISLHDFEPGAQTSLVDEIEYTWDKDEQRYKFGFHSELHGGSERNASIVTKEQYDFTGIEAVRLSASYAPGTVAGDHLNVYPSNTDYALNEAMLGQKIGGRYSITDLTGQHLHEFKVDLSGKYYLYMTAEQHSASGWIYYYLYEQDFDGGSKGHVALVKKPYKLKILSPESLGGSMPAGDVKLTLSTDSSVAGETISTAYRDEVFNISFNLMDETAHCVGYELLDANNNHVYYTKMFESADGSGAANGLSFELTSEVIKAGKDHRGENEEIRIRPIFEHEQAKVKILSQDFASMGKSELSVSVNEDSRTAVFKEYTETIATVTWDQSTENTVDMNSTIQFEVEENPNYTGDYHFFAFKESSSSEEGASMSNPVYHSDSSWELKVENGYYEITPIIANRKSKLLLNVSGATHGTINKQRYTEDECVLDYYDGKYETGAIVTFLANPDEGYRAKWTYRDVDSNKTKTYYGSTFYYQVQVARLQTDNYVYLEFEKCDAQKTYSVVCEVFMQSGDVFHGASADPKDYTAVESAQVSLNGKVKQTGEDGCTDLMELDGLPGETHTALVLANNRTYIQDVVIPADASEKTSILQEMKLSYYTDGPHVTSVQYYNHDGVVQNGDTIYVTQDSPSVIIGAKIDKSGRDVTDVAFQLKDKDGAVKGESELATRNGSEYIWSTSLAYTAEDGDQIWIELLHIERDENGKEVSRESYGEVNAGFTIVIAQYSEVVYVPDTGIARNMYVPFFGNVYPLLGIKGVKPILKSSVSGNIMYLTIGASFFNGNYNFIADKGKPKFSWSNWTAYENTFARSMKAMSGVKAEGGRSEATQKLKKSAVSFNLSASVQLALYNMLDQETLQSELAVVGTYLMFGANVTYTYNYPIMVWYVPCFVCLTVSGDFSDTVVVYAKDTNGYVELENMHDPTLSSYKPDNDLNFAFGLNIALGVGINGLADIAGSGNGRFNFDWVDWSWGTGKFNFAIDLKLDLLVFGLSHSFKIANLEIFNTNPYTDVDTEDVMAAADENLMNVPLSNFAMKSASSYQQSVKTETKIGQVASGAGSQALITDAYEFSKPKLYPMGDDKYMIIATVDSEYVNVPKGEPSQTDTGSSTVVSYAIYDKSQGSFEKENGKIFQSLEPASEIGKSVDFHPCVTEIGDSGKYLITWNSMPLLGNDTSKLNLINARTVVKAAVYDSEDNKVEAYKSMVTEDSEDTEQPIYSNIVLDTAYDSTNEEVVVLYRVLNLNGLSDDSTVKDYSDVGSKLMYTSIKLDDEDETTFKDGVELASGGKEENGRKIIKSADLEIMDGTPVITYQITEGEQANLFSTAEEGSENHIYLTNLSYDKTNGGYKVDKEKEATSNLDGTYHANPQLLSYTKNDKAQHFLMWKTERGMLSIDPIEFLNQKESDSKEKTADNTVATTEETAAISNETAGTMGDYQIIQGKDGKVYSIWTEGNEDGDGTKVMMAALESFTNTHDDSEGLSWGTGSEVFATDSNEFIRSMSPIVDENGVLHLLYRKSLISSESENDGYSEVVMQSVNLNQDGLTLENYSMNSDEEVEKEYSDIANMKLMISNHYPKAGETVTITGRVKNSGIQANEEQDLTLYVNGEETSKKVTIPSMASGMKKEFSIDYTFPDDYDGKPATFTVKSENGEKITATTCEGAVLSITSADYEQQNYPEDDSQVSYQVTAYISNTGNDISEETTLVLSHLESTKDSEGENILDDTVYGTCKVPAIKPGDTKSVTFLVNDIPTELFKKNMFGVGSIAGALYTDYEDESSRSMIANYADYLRLEEKPAVTEITTATSKKVGVGQSLRLTTLVSPSRAQVFANLKYESSNTEIATVDANGVITGIKEGTCTITVTEKNGAKRTVTVQVTKDAADPGDEEYEDGKKPGDGSDKETEPGSGQLSGGDATDDENSDGQSSQNGKTKTGDNNPVMLLLLILIVSGLAAAVIIKRKKKQ